MDDAELVDAIQMLARCVQLIAHGNEQPTGLEAIGMSIEGAGKPGHNPLSDAISGAGSDIAAAIYALANAVDR